MKQENSPIKNTRGKKGSAVKEAEPLTEEEIEARKKAKAEQQARVKERNEKYLEELQKKKAIKESE
jgi:DNA-binding protein H-NS